MWAFVLAIVSLILGLAFLATGLFWGAPLVLVAFGLLAWGLLSAKRNDPSIGTVERAKQPEPTGQPRMSPGGGGTANERQGQL